MQSFFVWSYVGLSVITMIAATWFLGDAQPAGSGYEKGWIFGLAWFPILAFGFIESVNARQIPESIFGAIQAVFLPYVWIFFFGIWQGQSFAFMIISSCITTFIAAFFLHALALRGPLRQAGNSAVAEVLIPHLFLYIPALILAWMMVQFLWNAEGGSWIFLLGLFFAVGQRIFAMRVGLKNLFS